jgi:hypothetical protein
MRVISAAVLIAMSVCSAIEAKTMKPAPVIPVCSILSVTTSTACQTVAGNNDSAADMNSFNSGAGVFNVSNWLLADKSEDSSTPTAPFNLIGFVDAAKSGAWSVASFGNYEFAALVVKGGSVAWVAYLLNTTLLSGSWSTVDLVNGGGNQPDLSHLSLYVGGKILPPPSPVPVPASGLLIFAGLGAIGALRLRKRT